MLKIEANKGFTAPKIDNAGTRGEAASAGGFEGTEMEGEDFATVLQNLTGKKSDSLPKETQTAKQKDSRSESDNKTGKTDDDSTKQARENRSAQREEQAGAANARFAGNENVLVEAESSLPPARAILHIADMERIVASLRSQTFEGNNQVVITLKNSVFDGLQIKLTAHENHRVTAELIAANEKVKAQLDARSGELADLLRQRGIKLSNLQTSVSAETNSDKRDGQNAGSLETVTNQKPLVEAETEEIESSETASSYRV